ncbi:UNVERIFIED_CONTAM: hypothetical protein K2H54_031900 [Gekko kuhli]
MCYCYRCKLRNLLSEKKSALRMLVLVMVVLLVLTHVVGKVRVLQCAVVDSYPILHKYLHPGDLIISAMVSQTFFMTTPKDFKCQPPGILSEMFVLMPQNYQHILALVFAVKEINENPMILPNTSLGFRIYDSYQNPKLTYRTALQLISPRNRFVPNYRCDIQDNVQAVLEDIHSDNSQLIHDLLNIYKIPQLDLVDKTTKQQEAANGSGSRWNYFALPSSLIKAVSCSALLLLGTSLMPLNYTIRHAFNKMVHWVGGPAEPPIQPSLSGNVVLS